MQNSSTEYKYVPFTAPREIRLIELQRGIQNDDLQIKVNHTSLDGEPQFEALSYVWGPQQPIAVIGCGSKQVNVGPNLKQALTRLRYEDRERSLWIDRISINQEDLDERSKQVQLMGAIFSSAEQVLVWLGEEDATTAAALQTMSNIARQTILEMDQYGESRMKGGHEIQFPSYDGPAALAVRKFLGRPWFARIWTYQEIVLSCQEILLCGAHEIAWTQFKAFIIAQEVFSNGDKTEDSFLRGSQAAALQMVKAHTYHLNPAPYELITASNNLSLGALLNGLRNHQATDPRDKVFALLNVATDMNGQFLPDYRQTPIEVYTHCVKWLRTRHENLAFLALVEKKDKPDLVSWVPDFRAGDNLNFTHQPRLIVRSSERMWNASGFTKAFPGGVSEPRLHLEVRAICLGKIAARTDPADNVLGNVAIGPNALDRGQWHQFAKSALNTYLLTGEPIDLAFHRIRIWDCLPGEGTRRRHRPAALRDEDIPAPDTITYDSTVDHWVRGQRDDIAMRIMNSTTRKRMFRTDTGYLGIARRCLEVGDEIFVLMGLDTPCVLRKVGGNFYSFGGEAYVHGAMDGEVLLRASGRRTKDEAIVMTSGEDTEWLQGLAALDWKNWPFLTTKLVLV